MKFFISSIPFFDTKMVVQAYRLVTQTGDKLLGAAEDFRMINNMLQTPALDYVEHIGVEPFAGGCDFFVDFGKYQLLMGKPIGLGLPPEKLVCVVDRSVLSDNAICLKLDVLKKNGYRLAVEGIPKGVSMKAVTGYFDYLLLSFRDGNLNGTLKDIRPYLARIKLIVTDVPDRRSFMRFADVKDVLLSGDFYRQPITVGEVRVSPIKINSLELLRQINDEDFDLITAAATIERDPALSISLLRFINSGSGRKATNKIESIRGAVAVLGQKEVRKWATVAISVGLGADRPGEITRHSLIRAKFAENLATAYEIGLSSGNLFIAGLFSMLDLMLEMPMYKAVDEVAVNQDVKDALVNQKGPIYEVMSLVYAYERADWDAASLNIIRNGLDVDTVTSAFLGAMLWYRQLLDSIDEEKRTEEGVGAV